MKKHVLLILGAILLVGGGLLAWKYIARRDQSKAIATVTALGGWVEFADNDPDKPVVKVCLSCTQCKDSDLAILKDFPELQVLWLNGTNVTDAGLAHLAGLKNLETLYLSGTGIGDAGLAHLEALTRLQNLDLQGTQVGDPGLERLRGLTQLRIVFVAATKVTDKGEQKLHQALPEVDIARLPSY
jgi:hypothetical protein